jgi:CRISPR/Cas system CSM-associated protein Csm2 small subunit
MTKAKAMMIEIKKLVEQGQIENLEDYRDLFENQKNFNKIQRAINISDNISDMQSTISNNTKRSHMRQQYKYKNDRNSSHKKSTKSIKSRRQRRA